ncbi:MAG: peptidoglycan editing factor PgeF [Deltaproteobacteria bacterium]|nr:peptidoglycan editing factor PgeF [Deltaproteobacteria bacterium]
MDLTVYRVPAWAAEPGLRHGFAGRNGGNSAGAYASLNVSFNVGDDPRAVKDNYCAMKGAVGMVGTRMVTMRQRHGDTVLDVAEPCKEAGEGDAMVTDAPGVFLGVLTADCVPIVCWAHTSERRLAAVIHAGWRGTLAGVAPKTVRHIESRYGTPAHDLACALGPAIGPCCYEIGADVADPLVRQWGERAEAALQSRDGGTYLDLRRLNAALLAASGVPEERIHSSGPCTACNPAEFFSHRRESKGGAGVTGRQAGFIGWSTGG